MELISHCKQFNPIISYVKIRKKVKTATFFIHSNYILFGLQSSEKILRLRPEFFSELNICSVKDKLCRECERSASHNITEDAF